MKVYGIAMFRDYNQRIRPNKMPIIVYWEYIQGMELWKPKSREVLFCWWKMMDWLIYYFSGYTAPRVYYHFFIDGLGSLQIYQETPKCKATGFSVRCRHLDDCILSSTAISRLSYVRRFGCKYSEKFGKILL